MAVDSQLYSRLSTAPDGILSVPSYLARLFRPYASRAGSCSSFLIIRGDLPVTHTLEFSSLVVLRCKGLRETIPQFPGSDASLHTSISPALINSHRGSRNFPGTLWLQSSVQRRYSPAVHGVSACSSSYYSRYQGCNGISRWMNLTSLRGRAFRR